MSVSEESIDEDESDDDDEDAEHGLKALASDSAAGSHWLADIAERAKRSS
jgi:hypothetical protein